MKQLVLACEYLAPPIFIRSNERVGHVDLDELPVSAELKEAIAAWDRNFQITFDESYPPDSGFSSEGERLEHEKRGIELIARLRKELGHDYLIIGSVPSNCPSK